MTAQSVILSCGNKNDALNNLVLVSDKTIRALRDNQLNKHRLFHFFDHIVESVAHTPPSSLIMNDCNGRWLGLAVRQVIRLKLGFDFKTIFFRHGATHRLPDGKVGRHDDVSNAGDSPVIISDCFERGTALMPLKSALSSCANVRVAVLSCLTPYHSNLRRLFGSGVIACEPNISLLRLIYSRPLLNGVFGRGCVLPALAAYDQAFEASPKARNSSALDTAVDIQVRKGRELLRDLVAEYVTRR